MPSQGVLAYLPIAVTAIAAISAGLSWRSVLQARRIWQRSLEPQLNPLVEDDGVSLEVVIGNVSKTLAAEVGWAVLWKDRRAEGQLLQRFIAPDAVARVTSVMKLRDEKDDEPTAQPRPVVLVWCRAAKGGLHVWTSERKYKHFKAKTIRSSQPIDLLKELVEKDAAAASDVTIPGQRVDRL